MKPFRTLVSRVQRESKRIRHKVHAFPNLATRLLTEFEYDWSQDRLDQN